MIFTFKNVRNDIFIPAFPNTDVFCFFYTPNAVSSPEERWFFALCSSLRLKRNVLVLEEGAEAIPDIIPEKRWSVGSNSIWLSPRSLSAITEAYGTKFIDYYSLKSFLSLEVSPRKKTNS